MDLTQLTHYLIIGGVQHTIDEPVGFDGLKTTIKRGDYHGMSAEVSVGTLEFYNSTNYNAATLIRNAYNANIDTEVTYKVMWQNEVVYTGVVDLATYSEASGNATKISCKVGEIGVKTTFNNRSETEVDLNREDTIGGSPLAHLPAFKRLRIPRKTILYQNESRAATQVIFNTDSVQTGRFSLAVDKSHQFINFVPSENPQLDEFGEFGGMCDIADSILADRQQIKDAKIGSYYQPFFAKGSGWDEKYGDTTKYTLDINMNVKIEALDKFFDQHVTVSPGRYEYDCYLALIDMDTKFGRDLSDFTPLWKSALFHMNDDSGGHVANISVNLHLTGLEHTKLWFGIYMRNDNYNHVLNSYYWCSAGVDDEGIRIGTPMRLTISEGGYIKMTCESYGTNKDIDADMLPVHEALNKIVECISDNQMTCKSDLYGRIDSIVNPLALQSANPFGAGALKAITNGYKIRNLYSDGETERNMPLSFKDIIEALDALDCVGWGFVEEDGTLYVRVEQWDWFYKNNIILTINNPNEKTLKIDTDRMITSLNIGYKKYTTNEEINSIDSVHSERTFTSKIKAIAKDVSKLCKWIADNYSIEATRRKAIVNSNEEFKYDENIFVFELEADVYLSSPSVSYRVAKDSVTNVEGIAKPSELVNPRLSPRRMAERWKPRLAIFNTTSPFELTKGSVNYQAKYECYGTRSFGNYKRFYLSNGNVSGQLAENATIANETPKMKAETLKIKYPLTIPEYQMIKHNPYGLIRVDGMSYWLKEMTFTFKSGETELTLIPKI